MKFCQKRYYDIDRKTSTHYITEEDIIKFHGDKFFNQFKGFIKLKPRISIDNKECYFYVDYEFAARQTNSFLNPIG